VTIRPVTGTIAYVLYIRLPELYPFSYSSGRMKMRQHAVTYVMLVAGSVE